MTFKITSCPPPEPPGTVIYKCVAPGCHRVARRSFDVEAEKYGRAWHLTINLCFDHAVTEQIVNERVIVACDEVGTRVPI